MIIMPAPIMKINLKEQAQKYIFSVEHEKVILKDSYIDFSLLILKFISSAVTGFCYLKLEQVGQ